MPDLEDARPDELEAVAALVNSAYRGDSSRQGWTTEADYVGGQRTDAGALADDLAKTPGARLMVLRDDPAGALLGCVWLEPGQDRVWFLAMLTVRPDLQARQLGRTMLEMAEQAAKAAGAARIRLTVVTIRDELAAWYLRRGYRDTGARKPWPYDNPVVGVPTRPGLEFMVLEKML